MTNGLRVEAGSVVHIPTKMLKATVLWASLIVWGVGTLRIIWLEIFGKNTFLHGLQKLNLDDDLAIPSWYSAIILAISALLLFVVALASKSRTPKTILHWSFLGVIFIYLSADEAVGIHEMTLPLAKQFGFTGVFTFVWLIAAIPFTVVIAAIYIPFLRKVPRPIAIKMFVAGAVYVAGIIGMGMVSGALFSTLGFHKNFFFSYMTSVEEGLEIAGITLFIFALLDHLAQNFPAMTFSFEEAKTDETQSIH